MIGFGQNVYIPDANFKAYLVGEPTINTNGDAEIQVSEATAFNGQIDVYGMGLYDLTGIENFTALTTLSCSNNQLTSLDVSSCTALTSLECGENQLLSLDVSNNLALTDLYCDNNQLTSLDVSTNLALNWLSCDNNQLTSLNIYGATELYMLYCNNNQIITLDLSSNIALDDVRCNYNQLTSLDVSQNTALVRLECNSNQLISLDLRNGNFNLSDGNLFIDATNNNNLNCINVDDVAWSTANWIVGSHIDPQHFFSTSCPPPSATEEHSTNKELLKVTDLLGRETKQTNQPLFYIYDDGTVEKRIVIE